MVRLVFRPYTHVRRTICTSVSLRASITVSSDFTLHKHSSPSFGSQHTGSCSATGRTHIARPAVRPFDEARAPARFPCASGFATRTLARMLDSLVRVSRRVGSVRRNGTILGARRLRETRGAPVVGSPRLGARPATAAPLKGYMWRAWWRGPGPSCLPRGARRPPGQSRTDTLASNDFAHFSLSFQSSFHLSFTVLVRYRSPANIQLSMDITTGLALQSQATRLTGRVSGGGVPTVRGYYPLRFAISITNCTGIPLRDQSQTTIRQPGAVDFHIELIPLHSPLLGESLLVSFPPLSNMFKFSG